MSDAGGREWRLYLDDMIGFAEKVVAYAEGFSQAGFVSIGARGRPAQLELIGEAVRMPDGHPSRRHGRRRETRVGGGEQVLSRRSRPS